MQCSRNIILGIILFDLLLFVDFPNLNVVWRIFYNNVALVTFCDKALVYIKYGKLRNRSFLILIFFLSLNLLHNNLRTLKLSYTGIARFFISVFNVYILASLGNC